MKHIFPCHKKLLYCMFLMTCLGLLSGIWYGLKMNQDDVFLCQSMIQSSFVLPMDSFQYFLKVCLLEGIIVLFLFLCGFSLLGIPLILLVLYMNGFRFGLVGLMMVQMYQIQGILLVFLGLMPATCLKMIVEFAIASGSMQLSYSFIQSCKGARNNGLISCINAKCTSLIISLGLVLMYGAFRSTVELWMLHLFENMI